MSSKLKRFLSLLLAFTMVLSIVPVSAEGSDGTVTETDTPEYVAQIESKGGYYTTLQAAFEAAQDGDTIELLGDVDEVVQLSVSDTEVKTITLDLDGYTWDCGYGTRINAVNLTVKNGTIGDNRYAEEWDSKVDVFHFGGHAKLPSKMVVDGVNFYAELHVNNMAPTDEELGLLATAKSAGRAFNATEVVLDGDVYSVVTVQKKAYLTVNEGRFQGGINAEEGSFVTDNRKTGETDDGGEIKKAKIVTIMAPSKWGYIRTERGVTITFVDPTPVGTNDGIMQFTLGENSQNFTVQRLVGVNESGENVWEIVKPISGTSTIQWPFTEFGSETFRVDWDNNGTYDRLVVLVKGDVREVDTKEELKNAIATANDGTVIKLTADIDYGTDHLEITKSIILDLGGHTLTTRAVNYGLALKNEGIIVTNGKLNHAGTVAAIKVWSADEISNLEIDVTGTSSRGNTINGIVIQKDANGVRTLKNVKIHSTSGQGVSVGIETYECGNANTLVIGNMENVTIDAKDKGMLISAPCGTATNCDIKGGVSGIEICLKGNYSAWLQLVNSKVYGGKQAIYAHDELSSNTEIVNNGTLKLLADSTTKFATSENGVLLNTVFAHIDVEKQVVLPDLTIIAKNTTTNKEYYNLHDALSECAAGETVVLLKDVDLAGIEWAPVGGDSVYFAGEFDGNDHKVVNLTQTTGARMGLFGLIEKAYIHDLTLENVSFTVNADNARVGAIAGNLQYWNVIENVTIDGINVTVNGDDGLIGSVTGYAWKSQLGNVDVNNAVYTVNGTGNVIGGHTAYGRAHVWDTGVTGNNAHWLEGTVQTIDGVEYVLQNYFEDCDVSGIKMTLNGTGTEAGGFIGSDTYNNHSNFFVNCDVTGLDVTAAEGTSQTVGGFMAWNNGTTSAGTVKGFNGCSVTGTIKGANGIYGGFVGQVGGRACEYYNATANVNITAAGTAGGFVGKTQAYSTHKYTFSGCTATGNVSGTVAGGFTGANGMSGDGKSVFVEYNGCTANGSVNGTSISGGFIGEVNTELPATNWNTVDSTGNLTLTGNTASPVVNGAGTVGYLIGYLDGVANGDAKEGNTLKVKLTANTPDGSDIGTGTGHHINISDDTVVEDIELQESVAKVEDEYYESLFEAVAAANAIEGGATVVMLANTELGEKLAITNDVTIEGEYTITRADTYTGTLFEVAAGATLTLDGGLTIDGGNNWTLNEELYNKALEREVTGVTWADLITSEEGKPNATAPMFKVTGSVVANDVTIQNNYSSKDSNNGDYGVFQVDANATLTMTGATVKHIVTGGANSVAHLSTNSVWTINNGTLITDTFAGKNGGICRNDSGLLVMNGGEISNNKSINTNGTVVMLYKGAMEMNGGKICSNSGISGSANGRCAPIYGHSTSTFIMTDGEICHNTGISYGGVDVPSSIKVEISGGYIGENVSVIGNVNADVNGNANTVITGGIYSQDVSAWVAPGYACVLLEEGEYKGYYGITDHIFDLYFRDPSTGEQVSGVGPLQGNDLASIVATGKLFYADYYDMELVVLHSTKIDKGAVIDYPMVVNLNGKTLTNYGDVYPMIRVQGGANVTVKNGTMKNDDYIFVLGASDGSSAGYLTIESGSYTGETTVASVTKGTLTITGGEFKVTDAATYLLNCIDANYKDGSAKIVVTGGMFHGFNPEDNAAENPKANFCAEDYIAEEVSDDVWTVRQSKDALDPIVTITFTDSNSGETVTLKYPSERYDTIQKLIGTNDYADFVLGAEQSELLAYVADGRASNIVMTLHDDVALDAPINFYNKYFQIPVEYAITLDGNGHTITWADGYTGTLLNVERGVSLTTKNLTIDGENAFTFYNDTTTVENGQNWYTRFVDVGEEDKAINANVIVNAGNLTLGEGTKIQNVTIASNGANGKTENTETGYVLMYNDDLAVIKSNGGTVNMNGATITGNAGMILNAVDASTSINATISGNMGAGNKGGIIIVNGGTANIAGSITGNKAMARSATILGVNNGAEVTFTGIMENNKQIGVGSNTAGAMVVLEGASQFVMNGGSISNNVGGRAGAIASRWVGGNYGQHEETSIILNAGTIAGNTASNDSWNGASIFLRSPATIGEGMTIDGIIAVNAAPGELDITGGTFTNFEMIVTDGLSAEITGGTFDNDPSEWLADGYVAPTNDEGMYVVTELIAEIVFQAFGGAETRITYPGYADSLQGLVDYYMLCNNANEIAIPGFSCGDYTPVLNIVGDLDAADIAYLGDASAEYTSKQPMTWTVNLTNADDAANIKPADGYVVLRNDDSTLTVTKILASITFEFLGATEYYTYPGYADGNGPILSMHALIDVYLTHIVDRFGMYPEDPTITLHSDIALDETFVIDAQMPLGGEYDYDLTLDLNGYTITSTVTPAIRIVDGLDVTVKNGTMDTESYCFILGASDGSSAGNLTIESGSYTGETTVASVTKGMLTITGGEFTATGDYGATYLLNCIDANYRDGSANIVVTGGTYTGFDPDNNAADGAETDYVPDGYISETKDDGATYTVREANYIAQVGETKYEDLKEAIEACTNGETVMLIADIEYGSEDVVYAHGGATGFGKHDQYNPSIIYIGGTKGATEAENQPSNVNAVINLNGHSITSNADAYLFLIMDNAKITFVGDGSISSTAQLPIFWATGAQTQLTIDGGTYTTANDEGLLWSTHSGDVVVNGGYFSTTAEDASLLFMLNTTTFNNPNYFLQGQATLTVYGGIFKGFNPEVTMDDSKVPYVETDTVAKGYKAVDNGDGTYTVQPHIIARLHLTDPATGEAPFVPYLEGNDLAALIANGKAFYAGYYEMTLELLDDIELDEGVTIDYPMTINLSGKNITSAGDVFIVTSGANVTINGEGAVAGGASGVGSWTAVWADGGNVTINGGTYSVGGDSNVSDATHQNDVIYTKNGGTVRITGGTFLNDGSVWTLNENDANRGTITVTGGTFHNWNPEDNVSEGPETNFCAQNYFAEEVSENTFVVKDYVRWIKAELLAGNDVTLERDIVVDGSYIESIPAATNDYGKYPNYGIFNVVGENVTFDLNGHNIAYNGHATFTWNDKTVNSCTVAHGLFFANAGANLEICDSVGDSLVTVYGVASGVYSASPNSVINVTGGSWVNKPCQESGCGATNLFLYASHGGKVIISAGNFSQTLDAEGNSYLIVNHNGDYKNDVIDFSQSDITIYGGTFTGMNPEEAHFFQQTADNKLVMGETYNAVAKGYKATDNGNNSWTVEPNMIFEMHLVDANGEAHWLSPMRSNDLNSIIESSKVWYESLQGTYSFTLKVLEDYEVDETVLATFPMTVDLCGNTLTAAETLSSTPVIRVLSNVTVKNGTVDGTAGESSYAFIVGNSETAGTLNIADGTYKGDTSAISITNGNVNISGGMFEATEYEGAHEFTLNCIDSAYNNGTAKYNITGGMFYKFNPENNAAEGAGTNFLTEKYTAVQNGDYYEVMDYVAWVKAELLAGHDVKLERDIVLDGSYVNSIPAATNSDGYYYNPGVFNVVGDYDVVFDLNGHSITYSSHANAKYEAEYRAPASGYAHMCSYAHGLFFANADAHLEICDTVGSATVTVNGTASAVYAASPTASIDVTGGSWINKPCTVGDCGAINIFLYASHGGKVIISAGNFSQKLDAEGNSYLIVNHNGEYKNDVIDFSQSDITIYGGTFTGMNPEEAHFFQQTADNELVMGETYKAVADGYIARKTGENQWTVVQGEYVAAIGDVKYETLQAAIAAAQTGDKVVVLKDLELDWDDKVEAADGKAVLINVEGKDITLDLNEKTITVEHLATEAADRIYAVVLVADGAGLTVTGNGKIDVTANATTPRVAYLFWKRGTTGTLVVENGYYHMNHTEDSVVYTNGDEIVTIEGGTFILDSVGTSTNGSPWIFNAQGTGGKQILITGGTFNADVNRQFWSDEAMVAKTHYVVNNGNGTWTVKEGAVAYVATGMLTGPYFYRKDVGYATIEEAFEAAVAYDDGNITLLKNVQLTQNVEISIPGIVLNANGFALDCNGNEIVLTAVDATLTAAEDLNVTTNLDGYAVVYEEGAYKVVKREIRLSARTLLFKDIIKIRYYFILDDYVELMNDPAKDSGLLIWTAEEYEAETVHDVTTAPFHQKGLVASKYQGQVEYYGTSNGIPAKNMIDVQFAIAYVKLADGTYVYSEPVEFSPVIYAQLILAEDSTNSETMKDLAVALMNYGAAAQVHLGYKTDTLMNSWITDNRGMVWSDSYLEYMKDKPDDAAGKCKFEADGTIVANGQSMTYVGALNHNFYAKIDTAISEGAQAMGMLYWKESTYASVSELTAENADGDVTLVYNPNSKYNEYRGVIAGTAAKDLGTYFYTCTYVVDSEGNYHYGELVIDGAHDYARRVMNSSKTSDTMKALAKAMIVYNKAAEDHLRK